MGRLYLGSTTNTLNQRGQKTDKTVMTDTTKVSQKLTRKKMCGVRKRRVTTTKERKRIRRWKTKAKTRSKSELTRRKRE